MTAAIVAIIAGTLTCACSVSWRLGIWPMIILNDPNVKRAMERRDYEE